MTLFHLIEGMERMLKMRICKKCVGTMNLENPEIYLEQKADTEFQHACPVCDSTESFVDIDDILAPIITTLWEKGYNTVACCGGHQPSDKLFPGHYHKMYITFDLENCARPVEFAEKLIKFCHRNETAYLRADPTGKYTKDEPELFHLGLYITANTYVEHLKHIKDLMSFVHQLPFNKIRSTDEVMTEFNIRSLYNELFQYNKFFYDVLINDRDDIRMISFNLTGLYLVNIKIETALMKANTVASKKSINNNYDDIIKPLIKEHPVSDLLNENAKEADQYVPISQFYVQAANWLGHSTQIESFKQE